MIYVDFRNEAYSKIKENYEDQGWEISLFLEGDSSSNEVDKEFIRQTNIKYFHHSDEVLGGDFIRMASAGAKGGDIVCRFEVKYLFEEFKKDGWDKVLNIVYANIKTVEKAESSVDNMSNYSDINNKLIARPLNYESNKAALEGYVFRQIGDFVIALYMLISDNEHGLASFKVPKTLLEKWGISADQAIDKALENSSILFPPEMFVSKGRIVEDTFLGIVSLPFDVNKDKVDHMDTITCTTTKKNNGSAAYFYPGMKEKIYEAFGNEDYYVVFTATTEFHLHCCRTFNLEDIQENLSQSNRAFPEDVLSNNVYRYYGDRNELMPVTD